MLTDIKLPSFKPEIWGGIECTINRVGNNFRDQLKYSGHYKRPEDVEIFKSLGISALRYPVLWERHQPIQDAEIDWTWTEKQLNTLQKLNVMPIVGLVHHGSGPAHTNLLDSNFPYKLEEYAKAVALKFPWVEYYTPVNEPNTTARFSGLYGLWYPHHQTNKSYALMFFNQLKGIVLSMLAIKKINPQAKLVQTEDLSKTHSTPLLKYQADFENERRWLTYDVLCGKLDTNHALWSFFISCGISENELKFFLDNPTIPHIMGANYYVTSERYLDDNIHNYPECLWGGNGKHQYVDIEAVRSPCSLEGLYNLTIQAWERFKLPIALTEIHLNCTREEQMRWFYAAWLECCKSCDAGVNVVAITAWSLIGAYDWASLLTQYNNQYESGVFTLSNNQLRKTATGKMISELTEYGASNHPLLQQKGWWHKNQNFESGTPILIIGKGGTLAKAFAKACVNRSIDFFALSANDFNIFNPADIARAIDLYKPWAIINTAGYVRVDDAETDSKNCFALNTIAPVNVAEICARKGIKFMTFSSDLVFDGNKKSPYLEHDNLKPLNVYGRSKAAAEEIVLKVYPQALIIRTSAFFGPDDNYNFAHAIVSALEHNLNYHVLSDVYVSPTYVPDLVEASLDLFIDDESGVWNLSNDGDLTWAEFASEIADRGGYNKCGLLPKSLSEMNLKAKRPLYSSLKSNKGILLPKLNNAIDRFFYQKNK